MFKPSINVKEGTVKSSIQKEVKIASGEQRVIPVAVEELKVGKRARLTGVTRITKRVHQKQEVIDEPLKEDEVLIERVPINRFVEEPLHVREENGTTIVPVLEEVAVTEKKIMLREELHIRKVTKTVHKPQTVVLRREEAVIEQLDAADTDKSRKLK
jgi:stress response protein YsnF